MPFDTACPECSARLRLDAPPARGAPVECPKCGALFVPPRPKKGEAAPPAEKKKADKPAPPGIKKRKVKKHKTNPVILVGAIVAGFGALIGLGATMIYVLNRAGKVEEMAGYVPGDCNWVRGVNVSQLSKYPGYAPEVDKHVTAEVRAACDALAEAAGHNPDKFLDYFVVGKTLGVGGRDSTVYVLRSQKAASVAAVTAAVGGGPTGGKSTSAKGILSGATLYTPGAGAKTNMFVVVPKGSESLNAGVSAGREGSFAKTGLDACGLTCVRGSIWLVGRTTGRLKNYVAYTTAALGSDLPALAAATKSAPTFGVWTTPGGGGVRAGVAVQCADAKAASDLVRAMKDGPLGKGDESEPTNQLKAAFSEAGDKRFWSEFMQALSYRSRKECAYFVSSSTGDYAKKLLDKYNGVNMGTESPAAPAGQAGGGGGGGGPSGAGGPRGLVGGVGIPGQGGP